MHPNPSYRKFFARLSRSGNMSREMHQKSIQIFQKFGDSQNVPPGYLPTYFQADNATGRYLFIDDSCINLAGYKPSHYYQSTVEEYLKSWHPADYRTIQKQVFPINMDFLKTIPPEKYADIVFTYNYRILNSIGDYEIILQRFSYIPGETGDYPLRVVGLAFNITQFKNDLSIIQTIEDTCDQGDHSVHKLLYKKIYPMVETENQKSLSKRENEILQYMSSGLSSKQIADKLQLSVNTINNHRKSMLAKSGCGSAVELMIWAVRRGWV